MWPPPDMAMIFTVGNFLRISVMNSRPSRSGIRRSVITTWTGCAAMTLGACTPSSADTTVCPAASSIRQSSSRIPGSSSTTRIEQAGIRLP